MLDIIALHALFGSSIPINKKLLGFVSPIFLTGIRMSAAGFLLIGFNLLRKKKFFGFEKKFLWQYAQIIFVGVYLKYILRSWALLHMSAVKFSFLLNVSPFISAFLSYITLRQTITRVQLLGLCIGVIGSIPILLIGSGSEKLVGELFFISLPEIALFLAIVAHCYGMIISRTVLREHDHSIPFTNGVRMLGGGLLALLTAFFVEDTCIHAKVPFFGWLGLLILISNIICQNIYLRLLKQYTVTFVSFTDFLSPLFTTFYSWFLLSETITWHYIVSGAFVLLGLYLFYRDELKSTGPKWLISRP